MFDHPDNPTLLDEVTMKTRSISFVLQLDSALWQTYNTKTRNLTMIIIIIIIIKKRNNNNNKSDNF